MGKILGAVAVGALTVATGGTFLGFTGLTAGLLTAASSLVLSGLSSALTPKPKSPDLSAFSQQKAGSITRQIRQPITARRTVYGEVRASGPYAFIGSTNSNNFLHFIVMLSSHEVDQIGEIWANDDSITQDMIDPTSGIVTSGKYKNLIWVKKFLGTSTQGASSDMMSAFPEWTSNHKLLGISYLYVRLKYNRDVFASGIPNMSAWIKGKKLYDSRSGNTVWHHNPMLVLNDYLSDDNLGVGAEIEDIEDDFVVSGSNTCEEFVTTTDIDHTVSAVATGTELITLGGDTLQFQTGDRVTFISSGSYPTGLAASTNYYVIPYQRKDTCRIKLAASYEDALTGTAINISGSGSGVMTVRKNAEPRYAAGGVVDSDGEPHEIIEGILSAMAGKAVYSGGRWRLTAGKYETPTIAFDEDDLAGPLIIQTKVSRRERFNRVIGTYTSPLNNGQPSDYPSVKNDSYRDQDGGKYIDRPFDLPFTQRPHMAQRMAKILLETARQEIIFSSRFKLSAFKVQVGDNCLMNNTTYGWVDKPFEVVEWSLNVEEVEGGVVPYIEMKLKETASTIYDWNNGEETQVDPAPNTELPEIFNVSAPTGLSFDSYPISTLDGDTLFRIILAWDQHEDAFVLEGGEFEIQYRIAGEVAWKPSFFVDGMLTLSEIVQGAAGAEYDLQIRAVNNIGVRSGWQPLSGVVSGSSGGVTDTEDWGNFTDTPTSPPADTADWEDFSGGSSGDEDWGGFIT